MQLEWEDIVLKLKEWGADIYGVADLNSFRSFLNAEYSDHWDKYSQGISLGVYFPKQVIKELNQGPTHTYLKYYDVLNTRIDDICMRLANLLSQNDYRAFPVPASQREGDRKLAAIFSHRLAAREAGLGFIGKSCNLITEKAGPGVRLGTVLCDSKFAVNKPIDKSCAENCSVCAEICPAGAILNKNFKVDDSLSERLDAEKCTAYIQSTRKSFGKEICGLCLAACPLLKAK